MQLRMPHTTNRRQQSSLYGPLKHLIVLTLFSALFFASSMASATVMKFADLSRLIEISDVIVHGKVVDQHTYYDESQGFVVTDTTIQLLTPLYGKVGQEFTFQQWGGYYEDKLHVVPGDARFEPYEEVILFLHRGNDGTGNLYLSAMSQSKYTVYRNDLGQTFVSRDLSDLAFLIERRDGSSLEHAHENPENLKSFMDVLHDLVKQVKRGK